MIVDFQHHFTPPELLGKKKGDAVTVRLDENGNPNYLMNPLLSDLPAHVRMMDHAGIDAAVLSCGEGFDQPNLATCRFINDSCRQAELDYPGRFIGLAHVPTLKPEEAAVELKRCAVDLGFPGVVIASELQGLALDAPELRPFWKTVADLGLYVFVHPLPRVIAWPQVYKDDLGRMLGWEFSLMVAVVRLINSRLLDDLPTLNIQWAHYAAGAARYLTRINAFQQRERLATANVPNHNRRPLRPFEHYFEHRFYYDCAGWSGHEHAAQWGSEWVRIGLQEVALPRVVFATDYPQAVSEDEHVAGYVAAVRAIGPNARAMLDGMNAEKLIPNLRDRLGKRPERRPAGARPD